MKLLVLHTGCCKNLVVTYRKTVPVLDYVPRHEDVFELKLSITP